MLSSIPARAACLCVMRTGAALDGICEKLSSESYSDPGAPWDIAINTPFQLIKACDSLLEFDFCPSWLGTSSLGVGVWSEFPTPENLSLILRLGLRGPSSSAAGALSGEEVGGASYKVRLVDIIAKG